MYLLVTGAGNLAAREFPVPRVVDADLFSVLRKFPFLDGLSSAREGVLVQVHRDGGRGAFACDRIHGA